METGLFKLIGVPVDVVIGAVGENGPDRLPEGLNIVPFAKRVQGFGEDKDNTPSVPNSQGGGVVVP